MHKNFNINDPVVYIGDNAYHTDIFLVGRIGNIDRVDTLYVGIKWDDPWYEYDDAYTITIGANIEKITKANQSIVDALNRIYLIHKKIEIEKENSHE